MGKDSFIKYIIQQGIVSEEDAIPKGRISPIKGTLGYSSWIFETINFNDSFVGPIAWSIRTASIPYFKNF